MPRGWKKTNPGAVDDDAMDRVMRRTRNTMKQLEEAGEKPNKYDVMNDELEYGSEDDTTRRTIKDIFDR